ncbi:NAD(P)/FAD-dependent oxidoreductase [Rhodococcus sp. BP22]|uniref:NAD(P)/FAD-dependent oxidoreductase n=1 Tax=Rhodococcus sp. BP22 TaxID=2758566 RepID=UPI0016448324|nr:NAD(P)/FAD-dependent oxidoreductase [Rhodococcus sp. BP22]
MNNRSRTWDVAVIGGGAAGLSAAVTLARSRRSVIVIDAGRPRNAPAAGVHNYLTRDGISATELTAVGRDELSSYGGTVISGSAVAAQRTETGFTVDLADGQKVRARKLLVATGLTDTLPDITGLRERWGRDVLHCPYCHGWEVRDQAIGVLGIGPGVVHQALMFRQLSDDVTLFLHTAPEPTEEQWEVLAARGISVIDGQVTDVLVDDDRMTGVRLGSGDTLACQALVVAPLFSAHSEVLESLGLHPTEQRVGEALLGSVFAADSSGATQVPGVWVAGNVTDMYAGVINSAAAGFTAAAAINASLLDEDVRRVVAERRTAPTAPDVFSAAAEAEVCERVLGARRHGFSTESKV